MSVSIERLAEFLLTHLDWLRHRPEVDEAFAEIGDCAARMRSLVDGRAEQRYLGPCGAEVEDDFDEQGTLMDCNGDVYGIRGARTGRCKSCGAEHDQEARRDWLDSEVRDRAFSAKWIAEAYRVNVKTIRSWATERAEQRNHEGKLTRSAAPAKLHAHAHDRDGEPLYLVAHVLDLAAADAARRAERQAKRERERVGT